MSAHGVRAEVLAKLDRPLPGWLVPLLALLALGGGAAFVILAAGPDPARAWRAYHVNWLYWSGLSLGGLAVAASQAPAGGTWSRPVRRFAEASAAFLPISLLLFLVLWLGKAYVFPWVLHPIAAPASKAFWLRPGFLFGRDIACLVVLYGLGFAYLYHALRLDLGPLRADARNGGLRAWLARGWGASRSEADETARAEDRLHRFAVGFLLAYAILLTLLAFDLVMSLAPSWVSNLLGAFFFMGAWLQGLMSLALLTIFWRRHLGLESIVTPKVFHDIGKLCFAFTIFWAYLFFSQFLVIWYGNLPEETSFLFLRMAKPEWRGISSAMLVLVFLLPFWGLLGVQPKKTPLLLGAFATVSLLGLWTDRFVFVVPSLVLDAPALPLGWPEVLVTAGFLGLFGLAYLWFARTFPIVSPWLLGKMEADGAKH